MILVSIFLISYIKYIKVIVVFITTIRPEVIATVISSNIMKIRYFELLNIDQNKGT